MRYQNLYKGNDLVIAVAGADSGVAVTVDGTTVTDGVSFNDTHVVVGQKLLAAVGEHRVMFQSAGGFTFMERIVTVETAISGVLLTVDRQAVEVNETVEVSISGVVSRDSQGHASRLTVIGSRSL